jgi:hypothetical protein
MTIGSARLAGMFASTHSAKGFRLILNFDTSITSLGPLRGLTKLTRLELEGDTGITSLEPLKGNKKIRFIGASSELLATRSE